MKLLVTYNIPREPFQNLPADWEITFPEKEEFSKTELLRILPDYDISCSDRQGNHRCRKKAEANQQLWSGL